MTRIAKLFSLFALGVSGVWGSAALSGGVEGLGANQSAVPLGAKTLKFGFATDYFWGESIDAERIQTEGEVNKWVDRAGLSRWDMHMSFAYGITDFIDATLLIPYYQDRDDDLGNTYSGPGDIRASFKINYPPYAHNPGFEIAYLAAFDLPTGSDQKDGGFVRNPWVVQRSQNKETGAYSQGQDWSPYGASGMVMTLKLLMTANFKAVDGMVPLLLHLNGGLAMSPEGYENEFLLGGGAEFWISDQLAIWWAADGKMDISHATKHIPLLRYPMAHKVGAAVDFNPIPQFNLGFTAGISMVTNSKDDYDEEWGELKNDDGSRTDVQDAGTTGIQDVDYVHDINGDDKTKYVKYARIPSMGFFAGLSIGLNFKDRDTDGDGLMDKVDQCPAQPEDIDMFEDDDGCPEIDNDSDGIADVSDRCPNEAEDMDGFQDDDGCIDHDNDRDNVNDADDRCPMEPEDQDGHEDEDGCPDLDNDADGIEDNMDRCVDVPEDNDGHEDDDGCPDTDNDGDGLPDDKDDCPDRPENLNGVKDDDGCPD